MIKYLSIFILSLFIVLLSSNIESFKILFESSRIIHISCSLALFFILYQIKPNFVLVAIIIFLMGMYKELTDPVFDTIDILANCIGILSGYIMCKLIE